MARRNRLAAMRRAILREWHGGEEPPGLDDRVHEAGSMMRAILDRVGISDGVDEERLREIWREVAGELVCRHASPASLRNGCLTLKVLQPAMRMHLEQMKGMLLARLQAKLGRETVKSIRLSLG